MYQPSDEQLKKWRKEYDDNHDHPFSRWSCYLAGRIAERSESELRIHKLQRYLEEWSIYIDTRLTTVGDDRIADVLCAELDMIDHILGKLKELK